MADFKFDLETVDYLLDRIKETGVTRLKIKNDKMEIEIESSNVIADTAPQPIMQNALSSDAEANGSGENSKDALPSGNVVLSPIVGTFYEAPAPDKPAYAKVGQEVKEGDVLCIVESMKLMNEIKSEFSGKVKKILVKSGEAVDFDQPIMIIE